MSVTKDKKTGKWFYYGRLTTKEGKPYAYKKRGFATQLDALLAERDFLETFLEKNTQEDWDRLTQRYFSIYLTQVKESTYMKNLSIFQRLIPQTIQEDFTNVEKIQTFITECDKKYSKDYVEKIFFSMNRFFRWCIREGELRRNPMDRVHRNQRKQDLPTRVKFWEPDQFHRFLSHIKEPVYHAAYNTLFYMGIRKGELQALQWTDVDLQKGTMSITKTLSHNFLKGSDPITAPKTQQSIRTITVPTFLVQELQEWKVIQSAFEGFSERFFVFGGVEPMPAENLRRHFKKGIEMENKKVDEENGDSYLPEIPLHGLRHSHASYLINFQKYGEGDKQYSEFDIANRLGDRVETLRSIYFHWFQSADRRIADVIQDIKEKEDKTRCVLDKRSLCEEELIQWTKLFIVFSNEFQVNIETDTLRQIPLEVYLMNATLSGDELLKEILAAIPKEKRSKRSLMKYLVEHWKESMLLYE